jgi:hypothetical protein
VNQSQTQEYIDDRLLAPLRRHWPWTLLGLVVATLAAATRFASIGLLPPSFKMKPFAHAAGSTQIVVGKNQAFTHAVPDLYFSNDPPRAYALADMAASPEVTQYIARAAGVPASKLAILGPVWTELQRTQAWANGPKRASQIIIENDPYHIDLSVRSEAPPWAPLIDVETQAPSPKTAAQLANAVAPGLNAYVAHLQAATGVRTTDRYQLSQIVPASVSPASKSQLGSVGAFTFFAVFVIWCGAMLAVLGLRRDLRAARHASKVGDPLDRSSDSRRLPAGIE